MTKIFNYIKKKFSKKTKLEEDPVYNFLIDLQTNIKEIAQRQYIPKYDDIELNEMAKIQSSSNKKEFVEEIINCLFEKKGLKKDKDIYQERYNFLLNNFVNENPNKKRINIENFVKAMPNFSGSTFDWDMEF